MYEINADDIEKAWVQHLPKKMDGKALAAELKNIAAELRTSLSQAIIPDDQEEQPWPEIDIALTEMQKMVIRPELDERGNLVMSHRTRQRLESMAGDLQAEVRGHENDVDVSEAIYEAIKHATERVSMVYDQVAEQVASKGSEKS